MGHAKQIVILDTHRTLTPINADWDRGIRSSLMAGFTAPGLGRASNTLASDMKCGENANGGVYALGGAGGGVTLYCGQRLLRLSVQHDDHRAMGGSQPRTALSRDAQELKSFEEAVGQQPLTRLRVVAWISTRQ